MPLPIDTAIAKIRSVGHRTCATQVYYFDDYDFATSDATALCKRLGIPVTDDIVIEFPAERTFAPLSPARLTKLAKTLGASLPADYTRLLTTLGAIHLPGDSDIGFFSPESALSVSCDAWWFKNPATMPVLAISPYHRHCDGDSIGFIRAGSLFDPAVYVFKHERRSEGEDPTQWTEKIAESLPEFLTSYIDSLPEPGSS